MPIQAAVAFRSERRANSPGTAGEKASYFKPQQALRYI